MLNIIFSIPKTIFFNFKYLPFSQAIKLPIWVACNCMVSLKYKQIVITQTPHFAMIRIGYHTVPTMDPKAKTVITIANGGVLVFKGEAHIGRGSKIYCAPNSKLILGERFAISALTQIACYKSIVFGDDVQFSWDCLVMDSDTHRIYYENKKINEDQKIVFGNKIWIGCRCTILKGSNIPDGCVIGAMSCVTGNKFENNTIIAGVPAKSIKKIISWEI